MAVRYVILDRPLADKQRDAGWRAGKGIVEKYDQIFAAYVREAINGDKISNVEVIDLREQPPKP